MESNCPTRFESVICNLESDVRRHIRTQQQLKLHVDMLEDKLEEAESALESFD